MPAVPLSVLDLSPIRRDGTAAESLRNTLDLARHADRLGYARYWLAEHHGLPGVASAATAVAVGDNVTATFSEAVTGVSGTSFTLKAGSTSVGANVTYDGAARKATLDPTVNLSAGTQYTAELMATIKGATGTAIAPVSTKALVNEPLAWTMYPVAAGATIPARFAIR